LAEIPVLWVCDPLYDSWFDREVLARDRLIDRSYRLQLGDDWLSGIRSLIRLAKLVIVHGDPASSGLSQELQVIREEGRQAGVFDANRPTNDSRDFQPYSAADIRRACEATPKIELDRRTRAASNWAVD
jgi:hypothetical protein